MTSTIIIVNNCAPRLVLRLTVEGLTTDQSEIITETVPPLGREILLNQGSSFTFSPLDITQISRIRLLANLVSTEFRVTRPPGATYVIEYRNSGSGGCTAVLESPNMSPSQKSGPGAVAIQNTCSTAVRATIQELKVGQVLATTLVTVPGRSMISFQPGPGAELIQVAVGARVVSTEIRLPRVVVITDTSGFCAPALGCPVP